MLHFSLIETLIVLYCAWNASNILTAWQGTSQAKLGWIALIIWSLPILFYKLQAIFKNKRPSQSFPFLLILALATTTIGALGSLNALKHLALAIALAALLPVSWRNFLWLLLAISWMPFLGWFLNNLSPNTILTLRILLASVGTFFAWSPLQR